MPKGGRGPVAALFVAAMLVIAGAALAADDLNPVIIKKPLDHPPVFLVEDGKPKGSIVLPASARLSWRVTRRLLWLTGKTWSGRMLGEPQPAQTGGGSSSYDGDGTFAERAWERSDL